MLKKIILPLSLMVINLYAIVSITPVEIGEDAGFSATLKGSLETNRGNSDTDNYSFGTRVQYDNNKTYVIWSDFSFDYAKASGVTNEHKQYLHVRYIHSAGSKDLVHELFVQEQMNRFTNLRQRDLAGAGYRYHLNNEKYGNFYVGFGLFYEFIEYTTNIDKNENNIRVSSYIAYTKKLNDTNQFSYVGYYQPKLDDRLDYIISNALSLDVEIYKKLVVSFGLSYDVDSRPAVGIGRTDFSQKTSFIYKF